MLQCQIDGSKEILLVDTKQQPEILKVLDISAPPFGKASLLNSLSVDYEKYPAISKISLFHSAILGPGNSFKYKLITNCFLCLNLV